MKQTASATAATGPIEPREKRLAGLIARAFEKKGGWTSKEAAAEAKNLGIKKGFSQRNIGVYRVAGRKRISDDKIRQLARICGESEEEWVELCSEATGTPSRLLNRQTIVRIEEQLQPGDNVVLISSRDFLEPNDPHVANAVLRNLDRGVVYTYYFPAGTSNPHRATAADSYAMFRSERVAHYRFEKPPSLFGYSIDPVRFRFFSGLHTIVRFESPRVPALTKAYAYIEIAHSGSLRTEQAWYPLPESVWLAISAELERARGAVADAGLPILKLNPYLPGVRAEYVNWFRQR